jgi:hypothetical protein
MRRLVSAIPLCALLVLAQPARAGTELNDSCDAPAEFVTTDASLAQLAAAISAGGPVDILAVGSATTVGSLTTTLRKAAHSPGIWCARCMRRCRPWSSVSRFAAVVA